MFVFLFLLFKETVQLIYNGQMVSLNHGDRHQDIQASATVSRIC